MKLTKKLRFLFSLTALLVCMCMSTVAVNADTLGDYAVETTTSADSLEKYAGGKISLADAKTLVQNYVSLVQQLSTMTESDMLKKTIQASHRQLQLFKHITKVLIQKNMELSFHQRTM